MQSKDHWEQVYRQSPRTASDGSRSTRVNRSSSSRKRVYPTRLASSTSAAAPQHWSTICWPMAASMSPSWTCRRLQWRCRGRGAGARASGVSWLAGDIKKVALPCHAYDIWYDRAVFHLLSTRKEREAYGSAVVSAVKPGDHIIVATFAEDDPEQCCGLPIYAAKVYWLRSNLPGGNRSAHREPLLSRMCHSAIRPRASLHSVVMPYAATDESGRD